MSKNIEDKRKRLIFRSWHRGTQEIDLILGRFAEVQLPDFNEAQLDLYDKFLQNNDPDIFNWISGKELIPQSESNEIVLLIMKFFKTAL